MRKLAVICLLVWAAGCDSAPPATDSARKAFLVVSGDTSGWITPCGCTSNQSGGLMRRATYVKQLAADGDVIYADAGGAVAADSEYQRVKFEAILRGELAMNLAAHNIGRSEAALGPEHLRDVASRVKVPFISANTTDSNGATIVPPSRVVQAGGRRVALVGVLSPKFATEQVRVEAPAAALARAIAGIRGAYDVLIVLAYLPEDELQQLATALPEADAVIGGPTGQAIAPRQIGPTVLAAATNKGKFVVQLQLQEGKQLAGTVVEIDQKFADEPAQTANLTQYLKELGQRDFTAAQTGFVETLSAPPSYKIAGSASCTSCHQQSHQSWAQSHHGKSFQTLQSKGFHVDSYCQQCHTTGFGLPGGFVSTNLSAATLGGVGCENCHGPSSAHVADPKVKTAFAAAAADQCVRCHDHENSPNFAYSKYWPKIIHGAEPKAGP